MSTVEQPPASVSRLVGGVGPRLYALDGSHTDSAVGARGQLASVLGLPQARLGGLDEAAALDILGRVLDLEERAAVLAARADVDGMTGVLRREAGERALDLEMDRARRSLAPLVVAFVDVDGLKSVNDSCGHGAGDELIRMVASATRAQVRTYDTIARYGGDEFLCLFPGASERDVSAIFDTVARSLASACASRQVPWSASISVGLASLRGDDVAATLVERADANLYALRAAKRCRRVA